MKLLKPILCSTALSIGLLTFPLVAPAIADAHLDATDDIYWVITLDLAEGQDTSFEALMADMVAATMTEDGAKTYEWHRGGNTVHIYERYETNGDAGIHLGNFGENFAERFLAILTVTGLDVYGPAEGGVREGLAGFGAVFYDQVGGFTR